MADLKGELATLKIDRTRPRRSRWRWPLLLLLPVQVYAKHGSDFSRSSGSHGVPRVELDQALDTTAAFVAVCPGNLVHSPDRDLLTRPLAGKKMEPAQ